jgi:O-antigen ligase
MVACIYLMLMTASSTGILAIAFGLAVTAYFFIADLFPRRKFGALVVLTVLIFLVVLIFARLLYRQFMDWVAEDKNGMGRFGIFSSFGESFIRSPLFGLGPGVHGRGGMIEFHNTYLEILAATGVIGGIVFIVYTFGLFRKTLAADWKLFVVIASMYAYGLASFAMRRLVFWGFIVFSLVISEQIYKKTSYST